MRHLRIAATRLLFVFAAMVFSNGVAAAAEVRVVTPVDPGSSVFTLIKAMGPQLSGFLGGEVTIEPVLGDYGAHAQTVVGEAVADGRTLLLAPMLDLEVNAAFGKAQPLERLTPVAKLAGGLSLVLVVSQDSPIKSFADFASAAAERPLRLSSFGRRSVGGVARALLVKELGVDFEDLVAEHFEAIATAVAEGDADAGILLSQNLVISKTVEPGSLRPLVTFGAKRSPLFDEQVPTFNEITGNEKDDFTTALAIYGPKGLSAETRVKLLKAFLVIGANSEVRATAAASGLTMGVYGPAVINETRARDQRVLERLKPYMKE